VQIVAAALICGGLAVGFGAFVALHLVPTGLSPLRNAVSQYGISDYRTWYRVQTLGFAVAGVGAAIGVATLPGSVGLTVGLCTLFALTRAVISWFPMDAPGGERTVTGRRHGLLAIAAFLSIDLASRQLVVLLNNDDLHPAVAHASAVLAVVMVATLIGMGFVRSGAVKYFGLVERFFYLAMTAWLVVVAALVFVVR
jgi:hypothetical protein